MKDKHLEAVRNLHYWQYGRDPDNFTSMLYVMFQKADPSNRAKLALAFPDEARAYFEWCTSPTQDDFFKKYNLPV
jgi:hypothetical protein